MNGASIEELTAEMIISRPSLYRSFVTNNGPFCSVVRRYERKSDGFLWHALRRGSLREVLVSYLVGYVDGMAAERSPRGSLTIIAGISNSDDMGSVAELLAQRHRVQQNELFRRFKRGAARVNCRATPTRICSLDML